MLKKLFAIVLVCSLMLSLGGCIFNSNNAENEMLKYQNFNGMAAASNQTVHITFKDGKKYDFYFKIDSDSSTLVELNDKTYQYIETFTNHYYVEEHDGEHTIRYGRNLTYSIFKLNGCVGTYGAYEGKQAYFIYKEGYAILYFTNEAVNQQHLNQYKNENDRLIIPGIEVQPKSMKNGKW